MRMKMKRFLGILLSLALVLGLMPGMSLTAYADGDSKSITLNNSTTTALPEGYTMKYAVTTENTAPTDDALYTTSIPTATDAGT